jgi:hypothetical protein
MVVEGGRTYTYLFATNLHLSSQCRIVRSLRSSLNVTEVHRHSLECALLVEHGYGHVLTRIARGGSLYHYTFHVAGVSNSLDLVLNLLLQGSLELLLVALVVTHDRLQRGTSRQIHVPRCTGNFQFQQQEQEHVQSMSDKLGMYLPEMSKQSATAVLQQLRATSMANYTAFQKGRAAFAVAQADRALDRGLSSSSDEFYQRLQAGQGAAAQMSIKTGLDSILAAEHLDKSKKLDRAKQYLVSVAQQTQDPLVINQLQEMATKELGVNLPRMTTLLRGIGRGA